jgi:hypothetical protein
MAVPYQNTYPSVESFASDETHINIMAEEDSALNRNFILQ